MNSSLQSVPIYIISLPYATKRRESIAKQMTQLKLDYQLINAVDGNQLDLDELEKTHITLFKPNPYNLQIMSAGAIGCLVSHLNLYLRMQEENIPVACILEDDAQLSNDFINIINSSLLNSDWEILLLGHYSMRHHSKKLGADTCLWKKHIYGKHYIARPCEFPFLTIGYLIKQSAAHKLHQFASPYRMPADWITGNSEIAGASLRVITPPCIICDSQFEKDSSIEKTIIPDHQRIASRFDTLYGLLNQFVPNKILDIGFLIIKICLTFISKSIYYCIRLIIKIGLFRMKYTRNID